MKTPDKDADELDSTKKFDTGVITYFHSGPLLHPRWHRFIKKKHNIYINHKVKTIRLQPYIIKYFNGFLQLSFLRKDASYTFV